MRGTHPAGGPFRDARMAFALLTVVPAGGVDSQPQPRPQPQPGVAAWFPLVGLVLGAVAYSAAWVGRLIFATAAHPLLAVLIVGSGALFTRMLHFDGLADVADAWWGGFTPERRLEIMSDSATGAFGATAVAFAALVLTTSVAALIGTVAPVALFVAPVAGRVSASFAAWLGTPARPGGLGASVMGRPGPGYVLIAVGGVGVTCLAAYALGGLPGAAVCGVGIVAAPVVPHLMATRMGGVTGDVMGASVIVVECVVLAAAALLWAGGLR